LTGLERGAGGATQENEMLQTIQDESTLLRASSLYCVWIPSRELSGPPLTALWIDDEMRVFEQENAPEVSAGDSGEVWNWQVR